MASLAHEPLTRTAAAAPAAAMGEAELAMRRDLAACYRMVAIMGWDDGIATHISARVPGEESFLINPFGLLFEEVTASSLVKIDCDGNVLSDTPHRVNKAGFVVHSAVHLARADAVCVIHLHTRDGVAVSALEEGLLPLNQGAMLLANDVAFHDYEGVALDTEERERLAQDLGDRNFMLLRNHGTLTLGPSVAEAYSRLYQFERACTIQVRTLAMGRPLHPVDPAVVAKTAAQGRAIGGDFARNLSWPAMLRKLDRIDPSWRD